MVKSDVLNVQTEVLVIGGGIAGLMAAIKARENNVEVLLVDKAKASRSGASPLAAGAWSLFVPEEDDIDAWIEEYLRVGEYLADQHWAEVSIQHTAERQADLERYGVKFLRDPASGKVIRKVGLGMNVWRNSYFAGGLHATQALRTEAVRRGVKFLDRVMVAELILDKRRSERVAGAVGIHSREGTFYVFQAKAVVLAAGAASTVVGTSGTHNLTGDGHAMALRAGAELSKMEFFQYCLGPACNPHLPGMHAYSGHGVRLINRLGERFMPRYWEKEWGTPPFDPARPEAAPRWMLVSAVYQEMSEGRGPIYMDFRHLSPEELTQLRSIVPLSFRTFDEIGLDASKEPIEYTIKAQGLPNGGCSIDYNCETTISGLFAGGDVTNKPMHGGHNILTNLPASATTGHIAGRCAGERARVVGQALLDGDQVAAYRRDIYAPLSRKDGLDPRELIDQASDLYHTYVGVVKHAERLAKAVSEFDRLYRDAVPTLMAGDHHGLMKSLEARNVVATLGVIARASLMRTESRGQHRRSDFPLRDDANWLQWVRLKQDRGEVKVWTTPLPVGEWKYKPAAISATPKEGGH